MSDKDRRRQEEERIRSERIRMTTGRYPSILDPNTLSTSPMPYNPPSVSRSPPPATDTCRETCDTLETPADRRTRAAAGRYPSILDPNIYPRGPLPSLARTRSYGEIPTDRYLSQQFRQSLNLEETQPQQTVSQQTPGQSTRQTVPDYTRQQPIPDSKLVQRYRDPVTGMPSLDRLRQTGGRPSEWNVRPPSSQQMGSYLANLSRDNISQGILAQDTRSQRQRNFLRSRGFQRVEDRRIPRAQPAERFVPQGDRLQRQRGFVPQTERDMMATRDYRFNRPQREVGRPVFRPFDSKFAPVGRQQWGPLRRAYSMPDLSDPYLAADINEPSRMAQFERRLVQLPTADRESYRQFHDQISLADNPHSMTRMVPRPTIGNINDMDRLRLSEMTYYRGQLMKDRIGGQATADDLRQARRNVVRGSAYQVTALPTDTAQDRARAEWLAQGVQEGIPEGEDEYEEEEEE